MMARVKISGIYLIVNTVNGKVYVGQAVDIQRRWRRHKTDLRGGYHTNKRLQRAWNKYSEGTFEFRVLELCSVEQLDLREQFYLNYYMTERCCYNIAKDVRASSRGIQHTEESKLKMSISAKHRSVEHRRRLSEANKNRPPISSETRLRLSVSHMGKTLTAETRLKKSLAMRGKNHPNFGKRLSDETRAKMKEAAQSRPPISEATRVKRSQALKGRVRTEEAKLHMSIAAKKRKPASDETRRKISEAAKRREAAKRALRELPPDNTTE